MTTQDQLNSFMISLCEKEFISKKQLNAIKHCVNKVLSVINLDDFLNGSVCFEEVKCKLSDKYIGHSSFSILAYAAKFRAFVNKYLKWIKDPEVFYEKLSIIKKYRRTTQEIEESQSVKCEMVKFPIMVNGNSFGYLELPSKLTSDEALKIKEFVIAATNCLVYE